MKSTVANSAINRYLLSPLEAKTRTSCSETYCLSRSHFSRDLVPLLLWSSSHLAKASDRLRRGHLQNLHLALSVHFSQHGFVYRADKQPAQCFGSLPIGACGRRRRRVGPHGKRVQGGSHDESTDMSHRGDGFGRHCIVHDARGITE
jgi:hypothetical protein